jgi:predicted NBD/HSP70 family sugar kinase
MAPSDRQAQHRSKPARGPDLSGTNLERAGDHNQRVTLQAIRLNGPITRAELVGLTGLTAPAIANITTRLRSENFIIEVGRQQGGRGQPAMRLAVNPDGCFSIGINVDRDHTTLVLLDLLGTVRARRELDLDLTLVQPPQVVARLKGFIADILGDWELARSRLVGCGIAMPDDLGRVSLAHWPSGYGEWDHVDALALFRSLVPAPVFIENDATAAALGELQFGHGRLHPSFFYILISGGLGGGLVIDGNFYRGADGRSGEIGFLPLRSTQTAARSVQEAVSLSGLFDYLAAGGRPVARPDQLAGLDETGQALISQWIELAGELLTEPLIAINCLINPEAIYLGGRLPAELVDRLAEILNHRLARQIGIPAIAPVRRAAMAADAPAIGAALIPFSHRLLPSRAALMKTGQDDRGI